jgi:hypothetical protein
MADQPDMQQSDHPEHNMPPTTWSVVKAQAGDLWDTAKMAVGATDVKDYRPMGRLQDTLKGK